MNSVLCKLRRERSSQNTWQGGLVGNKVSPVKTLDSSKVFGLSDIGRVKDRFCDWSRFCSIQQHGSD